MTTTDIRFNEKQNFDTIRKVIQNKFENVKTEPAKREGGLDYISFDYKGQNIYCHFCKDNSIHADNSPVIKCSSFSSDRPNEIKSEAFKIIAKHFNCTFWVNDCAENEFETFKIKQIKQLKAFSYKAITQTEKNIAWFLPRPKPDKYKGGMPLYCEDWLIDLAQDILKLEHAPFTLNAFCGMNKRGVRVDLKEEVKPDYLCDVHTLSKHLEPLERFELIIADPPYSEQEAKEIYGTPKLNYKKWTSELDKFLKPGGLLMVYHKYVMPNPNSEKYEVVKRVFIGNRTMHLARVCIVFKKKLPTS